MIHETVFLKDFFPAIQTDAALTSYVRSNSDEIEPGRRRASVLICPGGGYWFTCCREAEPVALAFVSRGYNAFVLDYSTRNRADVHYPTQLLEASAALAYIRRNAAHYNVKESAVAVCGFSAGGHLAACLATLWNEEFITDSLGISKAENRPFVMIGVYEEDIQIVKAALPAISLSAHASRSIAEYIYDANSLLTLSGKKLHTKRNHVNTFKNTYNYRTEKIDSHNLAEAADFVYAHCNSDEESVAMHRFFDAYLSLNVVGMLLYVDNQLVAVTAGEFINDETALIHLEKADTDFSGAYAAVNQLFIENYFATAKYVNREEDMGIEGLRRAKMSYRPSFLLEKYQITEV